MSADYWRGGWADNPMRGLPGTTASAMGGGAYGPLNALADILGAYWQKRNTEGALGYAGSKEMTRQLDAMTAPEYEQVAPTPENGSARAANTAYQQMAQTGEGGAVNTDFLHKNAPAPAPYGAPSLFQTAKLQYDTPRERTPEEKMKDAAFQQERAEHPGWFVGNTYVGDDATAKKREEQNYVEGRAVADTAKSARTGRFDSGMEQYGFTGRSRARSFDEVKTAADQLKSRALAEVTRKYGPRGAQLAEGMIDKAISDRLGAYGDAVLSRMRAPIDAYIQKYADGMNETRILAPALKAMQEYNIMARKIGAPEYDTKMLAALQKSGETKIVPANLHGRVSWNLVKSNGSPLYMDKDGQPVYTRSVWSADTVPTWKERADVQLGAARMQETARHNRASEANAARRTSIAAYSAARRDAAGGRSSGGADFNNKAVSSRITDMITKDKGDDSPYTMPEIVKAMESAGMSKDQIRAYLTPSVVEFYHDTQGDDAPDADPDYYGDGDGD